MSLKNKEMKTLFKILSVVLITLFQNCKSQDNQRYINQYEDSVSKLQQLAKEKDKFYGMNFSIFMDEMEKKKVKIIDYGYSGKTASSPIIYVIRLWFTDHDLTEVSQKNKYQLPIVTITFQEEIPYEFRALTVKYEGRLSEEVKTFLSNRKIEKIDFYGINGLTSTDRSSR